MSRKGVNANSSHFIPVNPEQTEAPSLQQSNSGLEEADQKHCIKIFNGKVFKFEDKDFPSLESSMNGGMNEQDKKCDGNVEHIETDSSNLESDPFTKNQDLNAYDIKPSPNRPEFSYTEIFLSLMKLREKREYDASMSKFEPVTSYEKRALSNEKISHLSSCRKNQALNNMTSNDQAENAGIEETQNKKFDDNVKCTENNVSNLKSGTFTKHQNVKNCERRPLSNRQELTGENTSCLLSNRRNKASFKQEESEDHTKANDWSKTLIQMPKFKQEMHRLFKEDPIIVACGGDFKKYKNESFRNMEHVVELYNIPSTYSNQDLLNIFTEEPRFIERCDDTHALLITGSAEQAKRALLICHDIIKSPSMVQASPLANRIDITPPVTTSDKKNEKELSLDGLDDFEADVVETFISCGDRFQAVDKTKQHSLSKANRIQQRETGDHPDDSETVNQNAKCRTLARKNKKRERKNEDSKNWTIEQT